jgi:hypothetical protein
MYRPPERRYNPSMLLLLACALSPSDSASTALQTPSTAIPAEWIEGICYGARLPLDYKLIQVVACTDMDTGYTVCSPQGWRIHPDATWEPSTCPGDYWRAYIQR